MFTYSRKVHYHETDRMGITHHSNYIRWMEEARIEFLDSIGCSYALMEEEGIVSPVVGVRCEYKRSTTFDDAVTIAVSLKKYNGVKLTIGYVMTDAEGNTVFKGESDHCFTTSSGKPIVVKRKFPTYDAVFKKIAEE